MQTLTPNTAVQIHTGPHKDQAGIITVGGDENVPTSKVKVRLDARVVDGVEVDHKEVEVKISDLRRL